MKIHSAFLVLSFTLAMASLAGASPASQEWARKLYPGFKAKDGLEGISDFQGQVPADLKADVLADIIETPEADAENAHLVVGAVYTYLVANPEGKKLAWNPRLQAAVLSLKDSPFPYLRELVLNLAAKLEEAAKLPDALKPPGVFYHFLRDEDEEVRMDALAWIARLPDGKKDLQAYIAANKDSDKRQRSVGFAQKMLDAPPIKAQAH